MTSPDTDAQPGPSCDPGDGDPVLLTLAPASALDVALLRRRVRKAESGLQFAFFLIGVQALAELLRPKGNCP